MFNLLSPADLLEWQIAHYTKRFQQARTTEERSFLRSQLYYLKKRQHVSDNSYHIPCTGICVFAGQKIKAQGFV